MTSAGRAISVEQIDEAMADLARLMRAQGEHGLAALPIFERLERERARLVDVDDRLDAALARVKARQNEPRRPPMSARRNSHISAA